MDQNHRHLRYFIVLAEELNFTRAAQRLNISQPSLSILIRKLEESVGVKLLSRTGGAVALTEAGAVFLEQARQILALTSRSLIMTRRAAHGEIGEVSIGYNIVADLRILPTIIPSFIAKWPDINLSFQALKVPQQLEGLRQDKLDIGFVWPPIPTEEFDTQKLVMEPLVAALPSKHHLASAKKLSIKDLYPEPLIFVSREKNPEGFHMVENMFLAAGLVINPAHIIESVFSRLNFVAMGLGYTIVPDCMRMVRMKDITFRPILPVSYLNTLTIVKKKGRGGAVGKFYNFTIQNFMDETPEVN